MSLENAGVIGEPFAIDVAIARDPIKQPFHEASIWNLPIGAGARYVYAGIQRASAMAYFTDADILILSPSAPQTPVYVNYDDWGAGNRCDAHGAAMFTAPIPSDFIVQGSHQGSSDGDTPNAATAILAADGHTIIQMQPFARCAGYAPTSHYVFGQEDLYGMGITGSHGGSGLSALGGTVRLGELIPGGSIKHALKLNLDAVNYFSGFGGFRWPAWKSDAGGAGYTGFIQEVRMGSLLAIKSDFPITSLETEPGRIIAQAFLNYGGYVVDSSGWSIYNFVTERSPFGDVQSEFARVWGYSLNAGVGANGWARDLDRIFTSLNVVDNWDEGMWRTVAASAGTLGVGLGLPRVAWAESITSNPAPPPPPSPPQILSADFQYQVSGREVTLYGTIWNGSAPYRYRWTFGDGTMSSLLTSGTMTHIYLPGFYKITLTVADSKGVIVSVSKNVRIV